MPKVVSLFNKQQQSQEELIAHIENLLQAAKSGQIKTVMVAAHCEDGNVMTGYCNLDLGEKQFLIAHAQMDVNYQIVLENLE